ncbi:MAG: hypothetical protein KGL69_08410, partial [Alphaproteobacteria bacterium]|nr:hypothetical protein [Alphaproteobacteria bacterium]
AGAAASLGAVARAQGEPPAGPWRPTFEPQDAWLDRPGTRHRLVLDATSATGAGMAAGFASNFYLTNKTGYGLSPDTLGVVIVLRHMATPFGYDDSIWAKYGPAFAELLELKGKAAIEASHGNPGNVPGPKMKPTDEDVTLAVLARTGARFAVCGLGTEALGGLIASKTHQTAEAVVAEFKAHLIPGALLVPAGIVAVNRAQEHGYALAAVG